MSKKLTLQQILSAYKNLQWRVAAFNLEQVLRRLAELGYCPNLLNNDNHWALSFEAVGGGTSQTAGKEEVCIAFLVDKKSWKSSPEKAVIYALKQLYDGESNTNLKRFNTTGNPRKRRSK